MSGVNDLYLPDAGAVHGMGATLGRLAAVPFALLALPIFLARGYGAWTWAFGAGLWAANRLLQWATGRFIFGLPQTVAVGVAGVSFLTRAWGTLIGLVLAVHFWGRDVAVPAAVLFLVLYTVDLLTRGLFFAQSQRGRGITRPTRARS